MNSIENWENKGDLAPVELAEIVGVDVQMPPTKPLILLVDDNDMLLEMLSSALGQRGYEFSTARSIGEASSLLRDRRFDILILDVKLADGDIFTLLDRQPNLADEAVVILMSGADELDNAVQALRRGMQDFIAKPFSIPTFEERLQVAIERWQARTRARFYQNQLENLVEAMTDKLLVSGKMIDSAYDETVRALGAAINLRDPETEEHCRRVSQNSVVLALELGYPMDKLKQLQWGSYLHDIGKIGVPENILTKEGALTQEEMNLIRLHPVLGHRMISNIEFLRDSTGVVLYHHERFDGGGYPHGLTGKQIPLTARIFSVIDTMDAMLYDRPYRKASPYAALVEELRLEAGKQFDPQVVSVFLKIPETVWRQAENGDGQGLHR